MNDRKPQEQGDLLAEVQLTFTDGGTQVFNQAFYAVQTYNETHAAVIVTVPAEKKVHMYPFASIKGVQLTLSALRLVQ